MLPRVTFIYPLLPQVGPQEFLICQNYLLTPTNNTPWFRMLDPQLLKIPDLYEDQFVASTATETGFFKSALVTAAQPETTP